MLLEPWAPREGPAAPTASGITLTISDAFLLRAEPLSIEKNSLWNGDYSVLSDFFSNSQDQREKNQSCLGMPALSLLQHPESWSKGQHHAGALWNDGTKLAGCCSSWNDRCQAASEGLTAPASSQQLL